MKNSVGFTNNSLTPISFNRVAAIFRYGYSQFVFRFIVTVENVQSDILTGKAPALSICTGEQVVFLQSIYPTHFFHTIGFKLIGESCSALCASSLENFSAVSGSHSLSEAVFLFSVSFLRLICSKHGITPP